MPTGTVSERRGLETVWRPCTDCGTSTPFRLEVGGHHDTLVLLCPACLAQRVQAVRAERETGTRHQKHPKALSPQTQAALARLQTLRAQHPDWTSTQLARALTQAGARTKTGRPWDAANVTELLTRRPRDAA